MKAACRSSYNNAACRRQLQMSGSVREAAADMKAACKRQLRMKL